MCYLRSASGSISCVFSVITEVDLLKESERGIKFWLLAWVWEHLCLLGYSLLQGRVSTGSSINCCYRSGVVDRKVLCEAPAELSTSYPSPKPNQALHDFKLCFGYLVHPLMYHYESFITCSSLSWPLTIQQNNFINAFPQGRGPLHWSTAASLALPEVVGVPGNGSRDTGSFPAWNLAFQCGRIWGLKWNIQPWCDAVTDEGMACASSRAVGNRQQVQLLRAEWWQGRSCCQNSLVPPWIFVLWIHCLLPMLLWYAVYVFLTSFAAG